MKKIFCLIVCCLLLCSCGTDKKEEKAVVQSVTCSEMKELVKDGAVLVDVRTLAEYKSGHLDEAVNLPVETIADTIGSDEGYEIVKRYKDLRENTQVTPKPITLTKKD